MESIFCQSCKQIVDEASGQKTPQGLFCSTACYLTYKKVKLLLDLFHRKMIQPEELIERLLQVGTHPLSEEDRVVFLRESVLKDLECAELQLSLQKTEQAKRLQEEALYSEREKFEQMFNQLAQEQKQLEQQIEKQAAELQANQAQLQEEIAQRNQLLIEERNDKRRLLRIADFERKERERQSRRFRTIMVAGSACFFLILSVYWTAQRAPLFLPHTETERGFTEQNVISHASMPNPPELEGMASHTEKTMLSLKTSSKTDSNLATKNGGRAKPRYRKPRYSSPARSYVTSRSEEAELTEEPDSPTFTILSPSGRLYLAGPSFEEPLRGEASRPVSYLEVVAEDQSGNSYPISMGDFSASQTAWEFKPSGNWVGPTGRLHHATTYRLIVNAYDAQKKWIGGAQKVIYRAY